MESWKGISWLDCKIMDFPGGNQIKLEVMGIEKIKDINKTNLKAKLISGFGNKEIEMTLAGGQEVKFTKIS